MTGLHTRSLPAADLVARRQAGSGLASLALLVPGLRERETEANAGVTHLMVRAALRADGGRLVERAERLGGSLGAVSTLETAGWSVTVPPEHVADAATVLAELAAAPGIAAEEVAIEARLQSDRARAQRDDMYRYPMQRLLAAAFAPDPYALPPLGDPERVIGFTAADTGVWQAAWQARRALVVVVGDGDPEQLLDQCAAPLTAWPAREAAVSDASPTWNARYVEEPRDKQQSALAMGFPAPPARDPSRHAFVVMGAVLSGLAGRLFDELREKRSLAYTVQAGPWMRRRAGAVLGYIATSPDRVDEAREAMLAELMRLVHEPVPDDELERARQYAAGLHVMSLVHTASVRDALVDGWCTGTLDDLVEAPARLRGVTAADVQATARVFTQPRAEFLIRGSSPS
jgi:zinc protease